jgi:uridine kinase
MNLIDIAKAINKKRFKYKPVIIAIEGIGGAGKTTFSKKLSERLGDSYVISMDDFILKDKISDNVKSNFDRDRLRQQVLQPIKNNEPAYYQRLEWITNTLSEPIIIPNVTYLIIEGVSSSDPSISEYFDYIIWIDTPAEIAKLRGSKRDKNAGNNNDELWENWTKTYVEYKEIYHPEQKADFIFDNSETILSNK